MVLKRIILTVVVVILNLFLFVTSVSALTTYDYDSRGRLQRINHYSEEVSISFTYDSRGNIINVTYGEILACDECGELPCVCVQDTTATVTFNINGGTFINAENEMRVVNIGESVNILPTAASFSREGFRFVGWFEDIENEATRWHNNNIVTKNITLYAKWEVTPEDFLLGDASKQGRVTSADSTVIARYLIGHPVDICVLSADINGDGKISTEDVTLLSKWLIGLDVVHLLAK